MESLNVSEIVVTRRTIRNSLPCFKLPLPSAVRISSTLCSCKALQYEAQEPTTRRSRSRGPISWVWRYFTREPIAGEPKTSNCICKICVQNGRQQHPIRHLAGSGTGTLTRHLERFHHLSAAGPINSQQGTEASSRENIPVTADSGYKTKGINGKSGGLSSINGRFLDAYDDEYDGVVVDPERLPSNPDTFTSMLRNSLSDWRRKEKKGVWLKLPVERSELVPVAIKEGFEYHHAEKGYVMLTFWIPDGPSMLPANASHHVGVGGFVVNEHKEVLVVQEKHCLPAFKGLWKIPTGFIHESEEIFKGAVREVKEETGIDTEFVEVIAFRHAHNVAFQKSDLFFICMLKPQSAHIVVDDLEIKAAKWMRLEEFVEQPMVRGDNMFKRVIEICMARLGHRYCGLSPRRLVSALDGKTSCLYYNLFDANCTAD